MKEIWTDIPGYDGKYKVSNKGRIVSLYKKEPMIIKPWKNNKGYLMFALHKNGKKKSKTVHRFVAEAFVPNPEGKAEVNHNDGDKENNSATNLEWTTRKENVRHANKNGLARYLLGEKIAASVLTEDQVREIRKLYATGQHSYRTLAKEFGVGSSTIEAILKRRTWKHVV